MVAPIIDVALPGIEMVVTVIDMVLPISHEACTQLGPEPLGRETVMHCYGRKQPIWSPFLQ
jgi:hypothetical protein